MAEQKPLSDFEAYQQNAALMHGIVREMKLIPELPSEVPTDVNPLTKVEFPVHGGVLTYMQGFEHPYKGFPFFEFVDKIDAIKKIQRATLSSLYHSLKARSWLHKMFLIFVPWVFGDILKSFVYSFSRMIDRFKIKPERYSDSMRELYRVFSINWHDESPAEREMRERIRDIVCMFLEFDNAYRFRFQDIIVELDKEALGRKPARELLRLLKLMQSRETTQEIRDTWRLVEYFLPAYLFVNKTLRKNAVAILRELDLEKFKLDEGDQLYCSKRKDYTFGHMLCQQSTTSTKDSPHSLNPQPLTP